VHRDGVRGTEKDVVEEADAVENRADLVIPVGPLPRHTQSEIDLGVCPATDLGGNGGHGAEIYARKSAKAKHGEQDRTGVTPRLRAPRHGRCPTAQLVDSRRNRDYIINIQFIDQTASCVLFLGRGAVFFAFA
jgi:hypothetical protein